MKFYLLFCITLCLSVLSYAQNEKYDNNVQVKTNPAGKFDNRGNKLKITLVKDSLFVTDKEQLVPIAGTSSLDSLIKRLPQPETLAIEFESRDGNPEKIRAIETVLKQCRCPITRHSISHNNNNRH